jgi:alpha-methylacyl-CoA racemase
VTGQISGEGPLAGVRVIELAGIGPGPVAGRMLADLGAEVIRVERPGQPPDIATPVTMRGRRIVVLDLKKDGATEALLSLIDAADVLIEPYRPGVAERLGIGPDVCLGRNPRLVYGRMTGWGQDGPWASMAGHDIGYIAITGALHAIGRADGPPQPPINLLGDFAGGTMFLLLGIVSALFERERSGHGQVIDAAIVDGTAALTSYIWGMRAAGVWQDTRGVNILDTGAPFYDVYETSDGRWMGVGAIEPQFWAELVRGLELDGLPGQMEMARWPELRAAIADRFKQRTQQEWTKVFEGTDACVAPILPWGEAARHPHIVGRGTIVEVDGVPQPAPAPRFSRTPGAVPGPAPQPGADTRAVLEEWGVADVDKLIETGAALQVG